MDSTSVGIVQTHTFTIEDGLRLESGERLSSVDVAYETYGVLNEEKDNAILIFHALSGDAHAAGFHENKNKPGWWDDAVGPGKAFDTNRYFIICSNVLGGCRGTTGPGSLNPRTGKAYGIDFPVITIRDMVRVQRRLIDYLGITCLLSVAGGSMGGMQALEWALLYPDAVRSVILIATTSRLSPQSIAFNAVGRNAIQADDHFHNGAYYNQTVFPSKGLSLARMIGHITYLSDDSMENKFGRHLQNSDSFKYDFSHEFQVESYLNHQGESFVERFDANSYLYLTKAMDYFDIAGHYGSGTLSDALQIIRSRVLVISFSSDWLFPPHESRAIVDALVADSKDVTYVNIASDYGHDAFLLETEIEGELVSAFLESVAQGYPHA